MVGLRNLLFVFFPSLFQGARDEKYSLKKVKSV